ncbi:phosphoglucosamine mutase [Halomicronema hongdechloris C2206]|uniref:Phosphoglucosamine mutase n=1 Tax=Halomicronema hongdechloris C2206 TaxID=1641165 RepID=A0A1Z3HQS2_9CYAN|nr:phosphoglucosamine mutase [Halomicronema hongdechloris]ASC72477.1 phosphoglucosamine mutase [Halomicronema hongdechloris C2206]
MVRLSAQSAKSPAVASGAETSGEPSTGLADSYPNPFVRPLIGLPQSPLFGTDGIRGQVGELLTAPLALHIGYWAGQILCRRQAAAGPVLVGQDSRHSSHMLASALAAGLTAAGMEVWHLGLCPTATIAYLTGAVQAAGGIMISASHNPPEDNGIKFFGPDGTKLAATVQAEIEQALRSGQMSAGHVQAAPLRWGQCYYRPELIEQYVDFLREPLRSTVDLQGLRIVLDMAWGAASGLAEQVFQSTGAEVIGLHGLPDGDRINVQCGSTHLAPLQAAVRAHGADLGFAFDGDADRVLAVDAEGRVVDGDYILYFWGQHLQCLGQLPANTIVSTVMANLGFERAWAELGGTLIRTQVGDQHVHAEMVNRGAKLGGEQSGHILCHHYSMTGDGILTALHLAALVQALDGCLAALVDASFHPYPQRLRNVRVTDRQHRLHWHDCDPVQQSIAAATAAMGDYGRVLVRPSGTEPVIRVMVEAIDEDWVSYWSDHIAEVVHGHLA